MHLKCQHKNDSVNFIQPYCIATPLVFLRLHGSRLRLADRDVRCEAVQIFERRQAVAMATAGVRQLAGGHQTAGGVHSQQQSVTQTRLDQLALRTGGEGWPGQIGRLCYKHHIRPAYTAGRPIDTEFSARKFQLFILKCIAR